MPHSPSHHSHIFRCIITLRHPSDGEECYLSHLHFSQSPCITNEIIVIMLSKLPNLNETFDLVYTLVYNAEFHCD